MHLQGGPGEDLLAAALEEALARHEILRTVFVRPAWSRVPFQVVADGAGPVLETVDLGGCGPAEREAALDRLMREDRSRALDPEHGPLLWACVLRLSPHERILFLSLPALCSDAGGLRNLAAEILRLASGSAGMADGDDILQYADYAEWQHELVESADGAAEAGRAYWARQDLSGLAALHLPYVRKGAAGAGRPESAAVPLDPRLAARIDAAAQRCGVPVKAFLLAAWQVLLWRLTRGAESPEILVGDIADGRKHRDLAEALGLYARCVPVRLAVQGTMPFQDCARQVRGALEDAGRWQEYLDWEAATGQPEGAVAPPAGFEHVEWGPLPCADGAGASLLRQSCRIEPFVLELSCLRTEGSLRAEIRFLPDVCAREDAERLAGQVAVLLDSASADPEAPVEDLALLHAEELRRLVLDFNGTAPGTPPETCFHRLFEAQCARTPAAPAVVCEDVELSYGELNARANRLARHLRALGVGLGVRVAMVLERSAETVVALLAVAKAGGAWCPLDLAYPAERLALMLEDAGPRVVLTQASLAGRLPQGGTMEGVVVVRLDADRAAIDAGSDGDLAGGAGPGDLAYVIFTSGSTGRPKGVAVEHRQLAHYVEGIRVRLDLQAGVSFATVSSFAADLGNTAIFPALASGGCLHVISQERASNPAALADYFARHRVDCLKIVPSHLAALLPSVAAERVLPRECLVLGGEATRPELIDRLLASGWRGRILNHYGPTETTVGTLTFEPRREAPFPQGAASLPLGRPLPGAQVLLLDPGLRPVPAGIAGEIYVGGPGLARGYLGRPEATAERFVPSPFGRGPGERLYRTGDVARFLPSGDLEFLGRADHQLKLRGYRVEPGEIEAALASHPSVWESVVVARGERPDALRLVAYVVPRPGRPIVLEEVRAFLRARLPEYMTPRDVVVLAELPLTPNGKVDRRALPAPEEHRVDLDATYAAPRSDLERTIAGIWQEVLQRDKVGALHNFFDLGGHSLLLIQVCHRLWSALGREVAVVELLNHPTVRSLADHLTAFAGDEPSRRQDLGQAVSRQEALARQRDAKARRQGARMAAEGLE